MITVARIVVLLMGAAGSLLSAWGMFAPENLIGRVREVLDRDSGIYIAVGARLLVGVALILTAPVSKFPLIFNIIGAFAIVAAAVIPFIGRARLVKMIGWFERFPTAAIRAWLLFGFAFGVFLIYAILPGPI